ncbi:uncharacterized protein WM294_009336 [Sarcoramphus papa]
MWIGCREKVLLTPCMFDSALLGVLREDLFLLVSWNTPDENAKDLNLHNLEKIRQIFLKPSLLQRRWQDVCAMPETSEGITLVTRVQPFQLKDVCYKAWITHRYLPCSLSSGKG